ncbi:geraniol 8-hydroxylase-like [Eucalyptus grandis]|uniref:geraniol 8-hydroxylase-like n=1 Tax=Eucalyptus grandis TaxID=71139 RepID=UPI00192E8E5B|nr:geraniol 8-hydroxylase-like [Eucalyptus grandis]
MEYFVLILCLHFLWGLFQALSFFARGGRKARPSNLSPSPWPLPIIGNLLQLGDLPHKSLAKLARTYGTIIKLERGPVTRVVISSPALAKEIIRTHDAVFSNRMVPDSVMAHGHDKLSMLWVPISPPFRYLRKLYNSHILSNKKLDLNQHLHSKKVQELITFVRECAEAAFRTSFQDMMEPFNPARKLREVVWQIVVEVGKPNLADYFPVLKKIGPHGSKHRLEAHFEKIFDIFDNLIQRKLQLRMETGWIKGNDVSDNLLDFVEDKNETLDMSLAKHLLLDVFVASSKTTAKMACDKNYVAVIVCYGGELVIGEDEWKYEDGNEGTIFVKIYVEYDSASEDEDDDGESAQVEQTGDGIQVDEVPNKAEDPTDVGAAGEETNYEESVENVTS